MAATVMTAEFGTIHYYSSLEEYSPGGATQAWFG